MLDNQSRCVCASREPQADISSAGKLSVQQRQHGVNVNSGMPVASSWLHSGCLSLTIVAQLPVMVNIGFLLSST